MENAPSGWAAKSSGDTMSPQGVPTLSDLGIDKKQSSRWQLLASLFGPVFEESIAETLADGKELTTAGALKLAATQRADDRGDSGSQRFEAPTPARPQAPRVSHPIRGRAGAQRRPL